MIDFLHFDTLLGSYNNNNVYDCTFNLSNPLSQVKKIYLKSIELPISFNNIRASNGTNTFKFTVIDNVSISTTYTILLSEMSYTSIDTLCLNINQFMVALIPSPKSIKFSPLNNKMVINSTNCTNHTISFDTSKLITVILGFKSSVNYSLTSDIVSDNNYLLAYDNYLSLYLADIPTKSTGYSNKLMSFKIPLNAVNGMVYFLQDLNSFNQSIEITDEYYILNRIRVIIYDRFGLPLTNGLDFSFSLAISYY